ncbi:MAG: hypothetical protein KF898_02810 [Parachlamydiales bacterium]|nr:hypothetical protein [Candidatus Acheromyda pituitae]
MAAHTVQEKSQQLVAEAMRHYVDLQADIPTQSRFEVIANAQGLLGKIDTFVRNELKDLVVSPLERVAIETDLAAASLPLREILQKEGPTLLMKGILSRTMQWGRANLAHDGAVALKFAPYMHMDRLPWVGFYGPEYYSPPQQSISMKLHRAQAQNLPESLQTILAGRNLEKLDLISNYSIGYGTLAIDAMLHAKELRYNWVSHPWVFPQAQYGQDLKLFLEMGIFEPVGVREVKTGDGIPFGSLKHLEVFVHPKNEGTAISPNNAHFGISPEMPISAFWHAMLKDDKTVMVRQLIANIPNHPMTDELSSIFGDEEYQTVQDHLEQLEARRPEAIDATHARFDVIAKAFEEGMPDIALELFNALDEGEKKWVHFRIWQLLGEPIGVHGDFGRVSFEGAVELPAQYHATVEQKAQALRELCAKQIAAFDQILEGHFTLFETPHDLPIPSAEYLRKKEIAQPLIEAVKAKEEDLFIALITSLQEADRQKLFAIAWELKGCPLDIHPDFGRVSLLADPVLERWDRCGKEDRLNVLHYFVNNAD